MLLQRSILDPELTWKVSLVKDSVTQNHPEFNEKSAWAKTVAKNNSDWGGDVKEDSRAHDEEEMENMFIGPDGKLYFVSDKPPTK